MLAKRGQALCEKRDIVRILAFLQKNITVASKGTARGVKLVDRCAYAFNCENHCKAFL